MLDFTELDTWEDLKKALDQCSPEQLKQPIQVISQHPVAEHVHECIPGISLGTLDALDILYARSVTDNRRHGEELVLYCDSNPHAVDGATMYEWVMSEDNSSGHEEVPIYPESHDAAADWTGPAQKLADKAAQERHPNDNTLQAILNHRTKK